uniref:Uncharacterized protein n=1 Tax=Romanomermis culicivorax TaxID=13658 RepID=A0A915ICD4_ROMCU
MFWADNDGGSHNCTDPDIMASDDPWLGKSLYCFTLQLQTPRSPLFSRLSKLISTKAAFAETPITVSIISKSMEYSRHYLNFCLKPRLNSLPVPRNS